MSPMAKPRPRSRSQACTPAPAIEPEGRAARQHDRVDALDRAVRLEQVGLARAGRAAAHVDAATAGSSKMMAVVPDARRASSAFPTRMPATSVMRFAGGM